MNRCIFLVAILLLLGACQSRPSIDEKKVFRYNEAAGISSLDPAFARAQSNIWVVHQLFSTLVELDENLEIIPGLAKRWELSEDGLIYQFSLRKDVFFHPHPAFGDSTRLFNAWDVKYSYERLQDPKIASPGAWTMQQVEKIEVISEDSLVIRLKQPFSPFLSLLAVKYCSVVPREAVEFSGTPFSEMPSGTGPFYLKRWIVGEKMILRKNPTYFEKDDEGNRLPYFESVVLRFIPDKLSAFLELIKGNIDFLSGIDPSYRDEVLLPNGALNPKFLGKIDLKKAPYLNTEYLAFDLDRLKKNNSPYADRRVRKAIHLAIDKDKLLRYLRFGIGEIAQRGMIPNGLPPYSTTDSTIFSAYDPKRSVELLNEAGFPNGKGLPELTLSTNPGYQDIAEFIQSEVRKAGIPLKVDVSPPATLRQAMATGKVDFFRASWIADYPDAENYLILFASENKAPEGPNYSRYANAFFDDQFIEVTHKAPSQERNNHIRLLEKMVMEETPVIPLFYDQIIRLNRVGVELPPANAMNILELRRARKNQ